MTTTRARRTPSSEERPDRDPLSIYAQLLKGELEGGYALRASQQMLQMIADTIPQAVWWKDRDCVFLGVNRALAERAGMEPWEIIGKTDFDMPWADGDPYGAKWYQDCDREVMESGVAQYGIQEELTMSDGSKAWLETNKVPLRDFNGEVIGILGTFEDVTERVVADQARQRAMEELDERVRARTSALRKANESLRREVEERIRLQAQERRQRSYAEALRDTAAAVAKSLDLDEVLEQVLEGLERLVKNHLAAVVLVSDSGSHTLAHIRETHEDRAGSGTQVGAAIEHLPLIRDLREADRPLIRNDVRSGSIGAKTRSAMGATIAVSDTRIGYLIVESASPGFFNDGHAERLSAIADLAAAAISNAQLFSAEAELATLEERQRLARELHDAVSQTLWTANLVSDSIKVESPPDVMQDQLERLKTLTRGALAEMRSLLLELRPASLVETPFLELLDQLVDALQSRRSITACVQAPEPSEMVEPAPKVKHALYRIAQEALNNVGRHSGAREVTIDVRMDDGILAMAVRDDGSGFNPDESKADRLGLSIMQERAQSVGAGLEIISAPGSGTTVEARAPLKGALVG